MLHDTAARADLPHLLIVFRSIDLLRRRMPADETIMLMSDSERFAPGLYQKEGK